MLSFLIVSEIPATNHSIRSYRQTISAPNIYLIQGLGEQLELVLCTLFLHAVIIIMINNYYYDHCHN